MTKIKEVEDKDVTELAIMAESIAQLQMAVTIQNDIILCLLHNFNLNHDLPLWLTKEGAEEELEPKIKACRDVIRRIYGPGKTSES